MKRIDIDGFGLSELSLTEGIEIVGGEDRGFWGTLLYGASCVVGAVGGAIVTAGEFMWEGRVSYCSSPGPKTSTF